MKKIKYERNHYLWSNRYTSLYHVTPTFLCCRGIIKVIANGIDVEEETKMK